MLNFLKKKQKDNLKKDSTKDDKDITTLTYRRFKVKINLINMESFEYTTELYYMNKTINEYIKDLLGEESIQINPKAYPISSIFSVEPLDTEEISFEALDKNIIDFLYSYSYAYTEEELKERILISKKEIEEHKRLMGYFEAEIDTIKDEMDRLKKRKS